MQHIYSKLDIPKEKVCMFYNLFSHTMIWVMLYNFLKKLIDNKWHNLFSQRTAVKYSSLSLLFIKVCAKLITYYHNDSVLWSRNYWYVFWRNVSGWHSTSKTLYGDRFSKRALPSVQRSSKFAYDFVKQAISIDVQML